MKQLSGNNHRIVGVMSGTSLDGIDLVAADFWKTGADWNYSIVYAETITYTNEWHDRLMSAPALSGRELIRLHNSYGRFTGQIINKFIKKNSFVPDLIASHGHTIFHEPDQGFTFQAGHGAEIASETAIPVVADFRVVDIALGGQGAPLVPAGDRILFPEYTYCLNLGGFANISFEKNDQRIAFDICPVNFILNHLAAKQGLAFDKNGELGLSGEINVDLLNSLNKLDFYHRSYPKSLGREWVEENFMPLIINTKIYAGNVIRTVYEHIALQIAATINSGGKTLVTGGGALNLFLVSLIKKYSLSRIIIPGEQLINFKEALIFAFLGLLRYLNEINCYASVTGSQKDSSSGIIFIP